MTEFRADYEVNTNTSEEAMIFYENRLLGAPRMRMLKVSCVCSLRESSLSFQVTNTSCTVVESFAREIKECYAMYEKSKEDKAPFVPSNALDPAP